MELPRSLKICGKRWRIRYAEFEDPNQHGLCDYSSRTISIREGLDREDFEETLLHELIHANLAEPLLDPDDEELLVSILSPRLVATLKQLGWSCRT